MKEYIRGFKGYRRWQDFLPNAAFKFSYIKQKKKVFLPLIPQMHPYQYNFVYYELNVFLPIKGEPLAPFPSIINI